MVKSLSLSLSLSLVLFPVHFSILYAWTHFEARSECTLGSCGTDAC
jgi:hypothetical protein